MNITWKHLTIILWIIILWMTFYKKERVHEKKYEKSDENNAQYEFYDGEDLEEITKKPKINFKLDSLLFKTRERESIHVNNLMQLEIESLDMDNAKDIFYQTLTTPLQSFCRMLKRFGGKFNKEKHGNDGDKFMCLDNILKKDSCIMYSFGIKYDLSFELSVSETVGCKIFAYDHTVSHPAQIDENIMFFKTGLGIGKNLKTLKQIMDENNHNHIDYLKIDVEGYEYSAGGFQNWIDSAALNSVDQFGIELHVLHEFEKNNGTTRRSYKGMLQVLQDLYKMGFRVISHEVNPIAPRRPDRYMYFEVVFMREKSNRL